MAVHSSTAQDVVRRISYRAPVKPDEFGAAFKSLAQRAQGPERDVLLSGLLMGLLAADYGSQHIAAVIRAALAEDGLDGPRGGKFSLPMPVLAVAGSGKKARRTRNISTLAALVAAAGGVAVVKTVSSGVSSVLGSADLMQHFGVEVGSLSPQRAVDILTECGFVATAIESTASRLDRFYGGRFTVPNAMSFGLAAMLTPISYNSLVFGLSHPAVEMACEVLRLIGVARATVISTRVSDAEHVDEFLATGELSAASIDPSLPIPETSCWAPKNLDTERAERGFWASMSPGENAAEDAIASLDVLSGKGSYAYTASVAATAAPMLVEGGGATTLDEGFDAAYEILSTGSARAKLDEFIRLAR